MKNHARIVLLFSLMGSCLYGQTFSIGGKVVDAESQIVPFANILLLKALDSTFVQGISADEQGLFTLAGLPADLYLLQASYAGQGSEPMALDVAADISLGALVIPLQSHALEEVVVRGQRPKLQKLTDRLVFTVENTVLSQGSSWDILKNTPGVIVNGGELSIRGRPATVYLNGRKVQLSGQEVQDLLQGLSGTSVRSVEVMANPPASFDAGGGPILNIVTSKSIVPGYKGSVNGRYEQAVYPKFAAGTGHFFKTDKLHLLANYSINSRKELAKTHKGINFMDPGGAVHSQWDTQYEKLGRGRTHNASLIVDYDMDDRNSLNFASTLQLNPNREELTVLSNVMSNGVGALDSTGTSLNRAGMDRTNLAFDLSYVHRLKKEGARLSVNGHYTHFDGSGFQSLASRYTDADGTFIRDFGFDTDFRQDIEIFTGQLDYATPIGSVSMETGAKISSIDSGSRVDYFNFNGNSAAVDADRSDHFLYDERVYAAYISLVKNWDKWSVKLGVRGEHTQAESRSLSTGTEHVQDFFEPFPSLYLLYSPSDRHSFSFDYGRNIKRPDYNDLNPFRLFFNEYDYLEGNPDLEASFSHNFNLNYTLGSEYFLDLYYRDNGSNIAYLVFQDNDQRSLVELKRNVLESKSYGLDFTLSKSILPLWSLYAYTSIFHEEETFLATQSGDVPFTNSVDAVYAYLANYLSLSKDGSFSGEVTLTYLSEFLFGSYVSDRQLNLNLGVRKTLLDNRIVLSLAAEDVLGEYVPTYRSRYLNQDNFYRKRPETQFVRFGFTYNFGNFRLEDNQRSIDKKERDRLKTAQ